MKVPSWKLWNLGRRLANPGRVQDTRWSFWEDIHVLIWQIADHCPGYRSRRKSHFSMHMSIAMYGLGPATITIYQWTWEESCTPISWIRGPLTLILAVDPKLTHDLDLPPLSHGLGIVFPLQGPSGRHPMMLCATEICPLIPVQEWIQKQPNDSALASLSHGQRKVLVY